MNLDLQPLHDKLIIAPEPVPEFFAGGIIAMPETVEVNRGQSRRGTVLAVGPGKLRSDGSREPMRAAPGDEIVYKPYAGIELDIDRKPVTVLDASDVIGVLVTA